MNNENFVIKLEFKGKEELQQIIAQIGKKYDIPVDIDISSAKLGVLKDLEHSFQGLYKSAMNFSSQMGLAIGGVKQIYSVFDKTVGAVVRTSSEFEQLRLRLYNLYQDSDRAAAAFEKFRKVALETPATLREVVEAGANLKAFGMDAENVLASVQDLAAFMGINVVEASNAVGRAFAGGAGAAMMLRDRGILELIRNFHGIEDLSKLTLPEFRDAMLSTFESAETGIAGSSARMADSYAGAMAQMEDAMDSLKAAIGDVFAPMIADLARALTPLLEKAAEFDASQAGITIGLLVLNALVVKYTVALMSQKAAWAALTVEQQKQAATVVLLMAAQRGGTVSTLTFSGAMRAFGASCVAAGTAVKGFVASIPVLGWIIIGVTAAYYALTAIFKKNTQAMKDNLSAQKDLIETENQELQRKKDAASQTVKLAEEYENLAKKTKRSKEENERLQYIHQTLNKLYPGLISMTGSYASQLDNVRIAASRAKNEVQQLGQKMWENSLEMRKVELQTKVIEAGEELRKEFTIFDAGLRSEAGNYYVRMIKQIRDQLLSGGEPTTLKLYYWANRMEQYTAPELKTHFSNAEWTAMLRAHNLLRQARLLEEQIREGKKAGYQSSSVDSGGGGGGHTGDPELDSYKARREAAIKQEYETFVEMRKYSFDMEAYEKAQVTNKYIQNKVYLTNTGATPADLEEMEARETKEIEDRYREQREKDEEEFYEKMKFHAEGYYEWKKGRIEKDNEWENEQIAKLKAEKDKIQADKKMPEDEKEQELKRVANQIETLEADFEKWKTEQIADLDKEKAEWDRRDLIAFEEKYREEMSHLAELRDLGIATYSEVADKAWEYYHALKEIADADYEWSFEERDLLDIYLKRAQAAQLAVNRDSDIASYYNEMKFLDEEYFQWHKQRIEENVDAMTELTPEQKVALKAKRLKELEGDFSQFRNQSGFASKIMNLMKLDSEEQKGILQSYQQVAGQIGQIWSQLYANLESKRDAALLRAEKRAKNERRSEAWLAGEKEKINADYEKKMREMKRAEKAMQIVSAVMNTAEGVTNALTIKPAWLAPIMAVTIGSLGAAQVALIASQKLASGGVVKPGYFRGKGTSTSDSNLIAISDSEYIISAQKVRELGVGFLDALNFGNANEIRKAMGKLNSKLGMGSEERITTVLATNTIQKVTLVCDGRELAKAVTKGNKRLVKS